MLIPLRLEAENFVLYPSIKIDFSSIGDNLVFILGKNYDTAGSDSNGAGKSLIADLITDLLFDRTIRRHSPSSLIGDFGKYLYSSISFSDTISGDTYLISKYRKHPKFNDSVFFYRISGKKKFSLHKKNKSETYKLINSVLGVNWLTFRNRNYFGQKDADRFLLSNDSKKAQIISDILDLKDLRKSKEFSDKEYKGIEKSLLTVLPKADSVESSIRLIENSLKNLLNNKEKEAKLAEEEIAKMLEKIESIKVKIKYALEKSSGIEELRKKILDLKEIIDKSEEISSKFSSAKEKRSSKKSLVKNLAENIKDSREKFSRLKMQLSDLKNALLTRCDKCGSFLENKAKKQFKISILKKKKEISEILKSDKLRRSKIINELSDLELKISMLEKEKEIFLPSIGERDFFLSRIREKEKWEINLFSLRKELKIYENQISELRYKLEKRDMSAIESMRKTLADLRKDLKAYIKEKDDLEDHKEKFLFSKIVFEKSSRLLFSRFLDGLNAHANDILGHLSNNDIEINFLPKTKKKSKKIVDKVSILLSINGASPRNIRTYSGGETGKVDIATQLALFFSAENKIPLLFLDEPFIGIDKLGRDKIIEILRSKADEGNMIIAITHDDIVSSIGKTIIVERKENISTIKI